MHLYNDPNPCSTIDFLCGLPLTTAQVALLSHLGMTTPSHHCHLDKQGVVVLGVKHEKWLRPRVKYDSLYNSQTQKVATKSSSNDNRYIIFSFLYDLL